MRVSDGTGGASGCDILVFHVRASTRWFYITVYAYSRYTPILTYITASNGALVSTVMGNPKFAELTDADCHLASDL